MWGADQGSALNAKVSAPAPPVRAPPPRPATRMSAPEVPVREEPSSGWVSRLAVAAPAVAGVDAVTVVEAAPTAPSRAAASVVGETPARSASRVGQGLAVPAPSGSYQT